ncbi:MAG: hypothetical protein LBI72_01740 [Flavobacteriaceae bacterium]|jgi:hypothetical protein|nr:hypothetical protein [Flavobacteriaceae bacterium]
MKKHVGVSLVFYREDKSEGVQYSFVFEFKTFELLLEDIKARVSILINKYLFEYEYLGVSDVYTTEELKVYNYLGRTSFFDLKNESDSQSLILSDDEINVVLSEINEESIVNVGFVYFNKDSEGSKHNSTIIVYTVVNKIFQIEQLYAIAQSDDFKKKIIKYSIENLIEVDLVFKGISDFYAVKGEGIFSLVGEFEKKEDVLVDILTKKQIREVFIGIENDYKFIKD